MHPVSVKLRASNTLTPGCGSLLGREILEMTVGADLLPNGLCLFYCRNERLKVVHQILDPFRLGAQLQNILLLIQRQPRIVSDKIGQRIAALVATG